MNVIAKSKYSYFYNSLSLTRSPMLTYERNNSFDDSYTALGSYSASYYWFELLSFKSESDVF